MKKSITIMVPAFNEEENLRKAVTKYDRVAKQLFKDYEILIFDDGSADKTGFIADALAKENSKVRVVHNKKNMGLGYNYRTGFKLAKKNYYISLSGEGEALEESVKNMFKSAGKADMVLSYISNPEERAWSRRFLTKSFIIILNIMFGLDVKYYNGYALHKTKILRTVKMSTNSFAYQAEIIIRLLKSKKKYSYIQIPYKAAKTRGSSMFRLKNLVGMAKTVTKVFFDIYFKKRK
jgi:glycosyltransferase involved in cell wall biosynthesis